MDTEALRSAVIAWLEANPTWQGRLQLESVVGETVSCRLDGLLIVFDFHNHFFINSSPKPLEWSKHCKKLISSLVLSDSSSLFAFFTDVLNAYNASLLQARYTQEHVVFQAALEAQRQLERDRVPGLAIRTESESVKVTLDLETLGMTQENCEELGMLGVEQVFLSLTYSPDLLRSTLHEESWNPRLFVEMGIRCITDREALNIGANLYFPGLVKVIFARIKRKAEYLPPGLIYNELVDELVKMGYTLEDVQKALSKTNENRELALEKLIRWSSIYDWIPEDQPNPFITLCLSLSAFLSKHTDYCRNCYSRLITRSKKLRCCTKKSCLRAALQAGFSLLRTIRDNKEWVELELSFISIASHEDHPILTKLISPHYLPSILRDLPDIPYLLSKCGTEAELIPEIGGEEAYNTVRRALLSSPLLVSKVEGEMQRDVSILLRNQQPDSLLLVESNAPNSVFEAEKAIYGSQLGFFMPNTSWFDVLRAGNYSPTRFGGIEVSSGLWAAQSLSTALARSNAEALGKGWGQSVYHHDSVVGVVEFISKPEYAKGDIFVITNSSHFAIRYFAMFPLPENLRQAIADELCIPSILEKDNPIREPRRETTAYPPQAEYTKFIENSDDLPPVFKDYYNHIYPQYRKNLPDLVWELMHIIMHGGERFKVELETGSNIFLWNVTVRLSPDVSLNPDLQSDFEQWRRGMTPVTIQLRVIFNDFFPDISPMFLVISPKIKSAEVSQEGLILMPRWEPGTRILDYLEQVVKYLLGGLILG